MAHHSMFENRRRTRAERYADLRPSILAVIMEADTPTTVDSDGDADGGNTITNNDPNIPITNGNGHESGNTNGGTDGTAENMANGYHHQGAVVTNGDATPNTATPEDLEQELEPKPDEVSELILIARALNQNLDLNSYPNSYPRPERETRSQPQPQLQLEPEPEPEPEPNQDPDPQMVAEPIQTQTQTQTQTQEGVRAMEAISMTWSRWGLIAAYISIYLMAFASSLGAQVTYPVVAFATSSFSSHSLIATVYVIQGVVNGMCFFFFFFFFGSQDS